MLRCLTRLALLVAIVAGPAAAQVWRAMGPPGGDVRSLAADPNDPARLFLGTADGHVFGSTDGGESWELLGRAGERNDGVVMVLRVDPRDPQTLYVGSWKMDPVAGGGFYRSRDGGRTWELAGLAGVHVRALAQAPSDPDILVAGTMEGVFRSRDSGDTWERISPEGDQELRQLDSVAIDPRDPDIIYVGTYHLPWKTTDGGRSWRAIHAGMIDDSDVFSIEIDRTNPRRIYASACSGIYRSDNAGALWQKIQGIPYSARRTHVIRQDPARPETVYAGTTEGLWRTTNAGSTWQRLTPRHWVINALVLDPARPHRVVLGTERLGVMISDDGGKTFRAANRGFHHRQIVSVALDPARPARILAVLTNAPEPVLATEDGGQTWEPLGPGLSAEGLLGVYATPDGWWAALERGGLVRYDEKAGRWSPAGMVIGEAAMVRNRRGDLVPAPRGRPSELVQRVVDMAFAGDAWFAATPQGLLASRDLGRTWERFSFAPLDLPVSSVRVSRDGRHLRIVSLRGMVFSRDGGRSWTWHDLPFGSGGAQRLEVVDDTTILATAHQGLFISRDAGRSWQHVASGLPKAPVQALAVLGDTFLASMQTGGLYLSADRGRNWQRVEGLLAEGYFPVVATDDSARFLFAASSTEGLFSIQLERPAAVAGNGGQPE